MFVVRFACSFFAFYVFAISNTYLYGQNHNTAPSIAFAYGDYKVVVATRRDADVLHCSIHLPLCIVRGNFSTDVTRPKTEYCL